jgi:FMN-dependent NADH-azoreductase
MKILHLDSSILGDASASRELSAAIVRRLTDRRPDAQLVYRDLASQPPSHVTLEGLSAGPAKELLAEFEAADTLVIGAPMYNLGVSSLLKTWIDHIVIAGRTFQYGPDGAVGLASGKRVFVAHARGGLYTGGAPATASEFAERYLRGILAFIGIEDPEFIVAEGLALGESVRAEALAAAHSRIARIDPGYEVAA